MYAIRSYYALETRGASRAGALCQGLRLLCDADVLSGEELERRVAVAAGAAGGKAELVTVAVGAVTIREVLQAVVAERQPGLRIDPPLLVPGDAVEVRRLV